MGGCQDIVGAASRIAQEIENGLLTATDVTDDLFKARLSTRTLPPVDLLIRSGGETRISNFPFVGDGICRTLFHRTLLA